jgi:hypothetical protein
LNKSTRQNWFLLLMVAIACLALPAFAEEHANRMQVIPEVSHDTSQPLRDFEGSASNAVAAVPRRVMPLLRPIPMPPLLPSKPTRLCRRRHCLLSQQRWG